MKQPTFSYYTHLIFSISKNSWNSFVLWLPVKTSKTFLPFLNYLLEKLKTKVYQSTEVVPWDGGLDLYISYKTEQVSVRFDFKHKFSRREYSVLPKY